MSQGVAAFHSDIANSMSGSSRNVTGVLLTGGLLAGPIYEVVGLAEAFLRPGFDLRRHEAWVSVLCARIRASYRRPIRCDRAVWLAEQFDASFSAVLEYLPIRPKGEGQ